MVNWFMVIKTHTQSILRTWTKFEKNYSNWNSFEIVTPKVGPSQRRIEFIENTTSVYYTTAGYVSMHAVRKWDAWRNMQYSFQLQRHQYTKAGHNDGNSSRGFSVLETGTAFYKYNVWAALRFILRLFTTCVTKMCAWWWSYEKWFPNNWGERTKIDWWSSLLWPLRFLFVNEFSANHKMFCCCDLAYV